MKYVLIANPISGGGSSSRISTIREHFEKCGKILEFKLTQKRGDAESIAAEYRDVDDVIIIAAGGDGTLNEVINGIYPSTTPVAFIPLGTTNVFAIETKIPFSLDSACNAILSGQIVEVSVGEANGRKFILMLGFGLDAEAVRSVNVSIKRRAGKLAYALSGINAFLFYRVPETKVELDSGEILSGYGGVISNCASYGGNFKLSPDASLYEHSLELVLFKKRSLVSILMIALKVGFGIRLNDTDVMRRVFSNATVVSNNIPFQIDGDEYSDINQQVNILPEKIRMLLPKSEYELQ